MSPPFSVLLLGLKHSGKSTLARVAAKQLGVRRIDTDDLVAELSGAANAREVFRRHGKAAFMTWESEALKKALVTAQNESTIIATGGGIADNIAALALIQSDWPPTLYLEEDPLVLYSRISARSIPAFLDPSRPRDHFVELAAERAEVYRAIATAILPIHGLTIPQAVKLLISSIRRIHAG